MAKALIIGAGPAGLMAADVLARAGVAVTVADAMPSVGRKLLMAGKSGLNITKIEDDFIAAYPAPAPQLLAALREFGASDVVRWANELGQKTFVGSSGRVFPEVMKASPLLRTWLRQLDELCVKFCTRWRWVGWDADSAVFDTPEGRQIVAADVIVLAVGGASWRRLGSDGAWADWTDNVAPFAPANMGFLVDWSLHMAQHFGAPVKGCNLTAGDVSERGEFVISSRGIEGGGIYAVSRPMREGATLFVDLLPDLDVETVRARLSKARPKDSLSNSLRKLLKLDSVKIALIQEFGRPFPVDLAPLIKALPIRHAGPRPLDEAISVAGGLRFDALDDALMIKARPNVYVVGEMLDWEAPTGGYLITGCLATGRYAALRAVDRLRNSGAL